MRRVRTGLFRRVCPRARSLCRCERWWAMPAQSAQVVASGPGGATSRRVARRWRRCRGGGAQRCSRGRTPVPRATCAVGGRSAPQCAQTAVDLAAQRMQTGSGSGREGTRPVLLATTTDRLRDPETRVADVGCPVMGAAGDPPGPSALPAGPLGSVGAPRAHRLALCIAAGDRFDHTTPDTRARRVAVACTGRRPHQSGSGSMASRCARTGCRSGSGRSTPQARSSPTSVPTTGGAPTSNAAGSAASAAARCRVTAGLVSTASTASASIVTGTPGTAAVTAVMIWARRHRVQRRPGGQAWQPLSGGGTGQLPALGSTRARVGRGGAVLAASRRGGRPRVDR